MMKKQTVFLLLLLLLLSLSAVAFAKVIPAEIPALQTPASRLKLRDAPSRDARVIGQYYSGTQLVIEKLGHPWSYVSVEGYLGFMQTDYLLFEHSDTKWTAHRENPQGLLIPDEEDRTLNLYFYPPVVLSGQEAVTADTYDAKIIASLHPDRITVLGTAGDHFVHVKAEEGGKIYTGFADARRIAQITYGFGCNYVNANKPDALIALRSAPARKASILCRVFPGAAVYPLFDDNLADDGWTKLRVGSAIGYMMDDYLTSTPMTAFYPPSLRAAKAITLYDRAKGGKSIDTVTDATPTFVIAACKHSYLVQTETWLTDDQYGVRYGYIKKADTPVAFTRSISSQAIVKRTTPVFDEHLKQIKTLTKGTKLTIIAGTDESLTNTHERYVTDGAAYLLVLAEDGSRFYVPVDAVRFNEDLKLTPNASNG